ncbi:MAG: CbtB domain-containing protein [Nitrososphaera sp.]|jgi:putative cobalt transporter subunit CbtB
MSTINEMMQITKGPSSVPKIAVGILLGVLLIGIFMVGFDQGHLFSMAQGQQAFDNMWMHEFFHDMRHAAGFPCH